MSSIGSIVITLLIGALAGWLAGFFVPKFKGGLIWNIIIGLIGGFIGGNVLRWCGVSFGTEWWGALLTALVGAILLLWIVSLFRK